METNRRKFMQGGAALLGVQLVSSCALRDATQVHMRGNAEIKRFTAARRFASLNAGEVAYIDRGSGRAVVLLHGFPLNSYQWRGAIDRLWPHARCIAPDFLGMGLSRAAPGQDVGPAAQADMLLALLDSLRIRTVDVIANDSGCAVAQLLMVRRPGRIRSMLLTNGDTESQCPPPAMQPVIGLARQGRFVDEWLAPWHADPRLARSDQGIGGLCYADRTHPTDDALRMYFGPPLDSPERKSALHAYAVALERNALAGIAAALRASRVPTRVVWGMGDTIFDAGNADYLEQLLGNPRGIRRLPGAKLFWPEERPDIIAAQARILWQYASVIG
jgi:pimeloyl-ACP methyl ester carboxylesterase